MRTARQAGPRAGDGIRDPATRPYDRTTDPAPPHYQPRRSADRPCHSAAQARADREGVECEGPLKGIADEEAETEPEASSAGRVSYAPKRSGDV